MALLRVIVANVLAAATVTPSSTEGTEVETAVVKRVAVAARKATVTVKNRAQFPAHGRHIVLRFFLTCLTAMIVHAPPEAWGAIRVGEGRRGGKKPWQH